MPPNGQTSSERFPAGGRRRRRSRGRVSAWRSSRERVADALSRHLAVSPPRLLAVVAATHAPWLMMLYRTRYIVMPFFHFLFSLYAVHVLLYLYSLCVAARIFAFRRIIHILDAWPRPLLSRCVLVFAELFAPHLRLVAILLAVRRSAFALNQISLLSGLTLRIYYRVVRRGFDRTPTPQPCSLAFLFIFCLAGLAASLPRSKSVARDSLNTTRSAVVRRI